jgi:tetratricopeptide (TPR) repeat protein
MIRNDFYYPVGDLWWGNAGGRTGPSQFVDAAALPNDTFVALDANRGRLFAYNSQGLLLYVWGGFGNREGNFVQPTALVNMDFSLYVLDAATNAITRFDLTEYGQLINDALWLYQLGDYEGSVAKWQEVLRMNGNFGLAYIGIARSMLRQGYYREAMRYFRLQNDQRNYGRAFGFYRRQWMEENFWMFALGLGVLMVVPPVAKRIVKVRKEINES